MNSRQEVIDWLVANDIILQRLINDYFNKYGFKPSHITFNCYPRPEVADNMGIYTYGGLLITLVCSPLLHDQTLFVHSTFDLSLNVPHQRLTIAAPNSSNTPTIHRRIGYQPFIEDPLKQISADYSDSWEQPCYHEYKEYVGLTQQYHYCIKCDEKK